MIDLLAIHNRAKAEAAASPSLVPAPMSAPPPAFTTDLSSPNLSVSDPDEVLFANKLGRKKVGFIAGGIAAALALVLGIASAVGGDDAKDAKAAAASAPREAKTEVTPPQAAATAIPQATPTPAPPATAETKDTSPAPPSTGAAKAPSAPSKARAASPRAPSKKSIGGPKLMKVMSSGV